MSRLFEKLSELESESFDELVEKESEIDELKQENKVWKAKYNAMKVLK